MTEPESPDGAAQSQPAASEPTPAQEPTQAASEPAPTAPAATPAATPEPAPIAVESTAPVAPEPTPNPTPAVPEPPASSATPATTPANAAPRPPSSSRPQLKIPIPGNLKPTAPAPAKSPGAPTPPAAPRPAAPAPTSTPIQAAAATASSSTLSGVKTTGPNTTPAGAKPAPAKPAAPAAHPGVAKAPGAPTAKPPTAPKPPTPGAAPAAAAKSPSERTTAPTTTARGRRPTRDRKKSVVQLALMGGGLLIAGIAITVIIVYSTKKPPEDKAVATATPSPSGPVVEATPTPTPSPSNKPIKNGPVQKADRAIQLAQGLAKQEKYADARVMLEAALEDDDISQSDLATDQVKKVLAVVLREEAAQKKRPTPAPDESEGTPTPTPTTSPATPDDDDAPAPTKKPTPRPRATAVDPGSKAKAARAKAAALDLEGALEALGTGDDAVTKTVKDELDARAVYLDAIGGAIAPGTQIAIDESGRKATITKADSKGVMVENRPAVVPWSRLPRATAFDLIVQNDKAVSGASQGASLVLYDLGLWAKGDARLRAWIDFDPTVKERAFAALAQRRGLDSPPGDGFQWRGIEWLTPDELARASKDLVVIDGKNTTREDARKLADKRRKERKPSKKADSEAARARAAELVTELGVTDVRTIVDSGDPAKRADIVIISDGYTAAEVPRFEQIASQVAKTVLTIEPFKSYARYVNVHRITVVEKESGIGPGHKTRTGARVVGDHLVCDKAPARRYAALAPDADLVIICANIKNVRSTGAPGYPGVITLEATGDFNNVALHELGHAFADLDDEYADEETARDFPEYGPEEEHFHINTTREKNPRLAKWHYWLNPALPGELRVDCFEGGYYREKGFYRPCRSCRMSEREGSRYCAVCLEALEKSFYERLEPIDDVTPRVPELTVAKDETQHFEATVIGIEATEKFGSFTARWFVDGKTAAGSHATGIKTQLDLPGASLSPGEHSVALVVDFKDTRVRRDDGLLSSSRAWRVHSLETTRGKLTVPDKLSAKRGELVTLDVALEGGPDMTLSAEGPKGSLFTSVGRKGRFVWAPPRDARGAYRLLFAAGDGATRVEKTCWLDLQDEEHNVGPVLSDPGVIRTVRGELLELPLEAFDADGDALVFTAVKKLPPGAELDPVKGVLRWTPSFADPFTGDVEIAIRVSDGKLTDELAIKIQIESHPLQQPRPGFEILVASRSPNPQLRAAAIKTLIESDLAVDAQLLELARLLRDREPEVWKPALEALKGLGGRGVSGERAIDWRRELLAIDLQEHIWDFTDRGEVRTFIADLVKSNLEGEGRAAGGRIQKDLAAIDKYNKDRGAP